MMKTSAVILRTHFWDGHVQKMYAKLQTDLGRDRVYCLFDVTNVPQPTLWMLGSDNIAAWSNTLDLSRPGSPHIVTITEADCASINSMHVVGKPGETGSKYRGETHTVAMARALRNMPFDYLWLVEYDVHCQGNFANPLAVCDAIDADFMAKGSDTGFEVRRGSQEPTWCWWPDRFGPELSALPVSSLVGCFFPMSRYSKAFLRVLEANLSRNSGFCEVYIPTLCVTNGLHYAPMPAAVFGAFRFFDPMHPSLFVGRPVDDRLYHPVKP
jgi:hypothetical protein